MWRMANIFVGHQLPESLTDRLINIEKPRPPSAFPCKTYKSSHRAWQLTYTICHDDVLDSVEMIRAAAVMVCATKM